MSQPVQPRSPSGPGGPRDGGPRDGGSPPPLVLLHGFGGSARSWHGPVSDGLRAADMEPLAVDLPGHGADVARSRPSDFTLSATLRRIDGVVDGVVDLVGYSMGGRLALHYAVTRPGSVRRMVLESSSPGLETEEARKERRSADEALARRIVGRGVEDFVDAWEELPLFASRRRLPEAIRSLHRSRRMQNDPLSLAASLRGVGTGVLPSLWDRLADVGVPTLLLVGEEDEKFVDIARRMETRLPKATVVVVDGAGHTVHLERPDAWLDAVVAFLAG